MATIHELFPIRDTTGELTDAQFEMAINAFAELENYFLSEDRPNDPEEVWKEVDRMLSQYPSKVRERVENTFMDSWEKDDDSINKRYRYWRRQKG